MIRHIRNIIAGNFAHWNEHHNKLIADVWTRTGKLDPIQKLIAQEVIIACMTITDSYFGPNRKQDFTLEKLRDKQVRKLNYHDYEKIIKELMKLFLILLSIRNDVIVGYSTSLFQALFEEPLRIFDRTDTIQSDRIKEIVFGGLSEFTKVAKILRSDDPILSLSFFQMIANLAEPIERKILDAIKHSGN
jgi:hypothetical protein